MPRALSLILCLALLALVGPAFAHGGHDHVIGTVAVLDASHAEVATPDGRTVSVLLTPETKYLKGKQPATPADLAVGVRVVIDAGRKGDALEAKEVRIGTAPAAKPSAAPQK